MAAQRRSGPRRTRPPPSLALLLQTTSPPHIDTLSLHDALPIFMAGTIAEGPGGCKGRAGGRQSRPRSEEHTSELQSLTNLVCRLLLEKKKAKNRAPVHAAQLRQRAPLPPTGAAGAAARPAEA